MISRLLINPIRSAPISVQKEQGLASRTKRKFKATTNSNHSQPVAPNLLSRKFAVEQPDTVYAGDITYIPTEKGWLYVAVLVNLYSRAVVSWAMSGHGRAAGQRCPDDGYVEAQARRRPDGAQRQGQSICLYQDTIKRHGFICSMSRRGNCWDNAPSESFSHTLKTELTHHRRYRSREEGKQDIFEYIEVFYNRQRRYSTTGYQASLVNEVARKAA